MEKMMLLVVVFGLVGSPALANETGLTLYISPQGSDAWSGQLPEPNGSRTEGPLASFEGARDRIRRHRREKGLPPGGVTVEISAGTYERTHPFILEREDSGESDKPIVYRARKGEDVRVTGGKPVHGWDFVTDGMILERLPEKARGHVVVADLKAQGISDYGVLRHRAAGKRPHLYRYTQGMALYVDDCPMQLARWPNGTTFTAVKKVVDERCIEYAGDRPARWIGEKDPLAFGYWRHDWAGQYLRIETIDVRKKTLNFRPPNSVYGLKAGQRFFALNLLSELDEPGEYYLDRETGRIYLYPPNPLHRDSTLVSLAQTLIETRECSHVIFENLTLECSRSSLVKISGGEHIKLVGCVLRNSGLYGVGIEKGVNHTVIGCDLYDLDSTGIRIRAGDRKTLTPAGHVVENCHFQRFGRWDRTYHGAVSLDTCVGCTVRHNLMHDAPHQAIGLSHGNDNLIEFNEIHSVCYETDDCGAIYTGRDWTMHGNVIRYNYIHHVVGPKRAAVGIYLDDAASGFLVYGNLLQACSMGMLIGGGRWNTIENNVFAQCPRGLSYDARMKRRPTDELEKALRAVPVNSAVWLDKYPMVAQTMQEDYQAPEHSVVKLNVGYGGRWDLIYKLPRPFLRIEDNVADDNSSETVSVRSGKPYIPIPAAATQAGFKAIPFTQIGLYEDANRVSWPVENEIKRHVQTVLDARAGNPPPVYTVSRLTSRVVVDGQIRPEEWSGTEEGSAMRISQNMAREQVTPHSLAWIRRDDAHLYVAVRNFVDEATPLRIGREWGQDDAVELAFRIENDENAPILVLQGYASGHVASSREAGASAKVAERVLNGVAYAVHIPGKGSWEAEWKIPFASLGVVPAENTRLAFNLTVRKTGGKGAWVAWRGTGSVSSDVRNAGILKLTE